MYQKTLAIIKPDAVQRNLIGNIIADIQKSEMYISAIKMLRLTKRQAEVFYAVHQERSFFNDLTNFMSSGSVVAMILEGNEVIERYRTLMGATDPQKAKKDTLREKYGTNVQNNAVHGSDGVQTAEKEIAFFFNTLEICEK